MLVPGPRNLARTARSSVHAHCSSSTAAVPLICGALPVPIACVQLRFVVASDVQHGGGHCAAAATAMRLATTAAAATEWALARPRFSTTCMACIGVGARGHGAGLTQLALSRQAHSPPRRCWTRHVTERYCACRCHKSTESGERASSNSLHMKVLCMAPGDLGGTRYYAGPALLLQTLC